MKHTEAKILEKAKIVIKDLRGDHYSDSCINSIFFNKEKEVSRPVRKIIAAWTISIKSLFYKMVFLFFDNFEGVRVGVLKTTGRPATIFPDNAKQPFLNKKGFEINPF